jgi:cytidylate kinase
MAVVAITQQLGSRGEDLGRIIAESLSYRFLSQRDLWEETARRYQVTPEPLLILDERKPHFWERSNNDARRVQAFYRAALLTWFAQDRVVAVGRAVAHVLPAVGYGLRVHVVAPLEERVNRLRARRTSTSPPPRSARYITTARCELVFRVCLTSILKTLRFTT